MSLFSEVLPEWDNTGIEPSGAKKTAGWLLNEKPPAEWFNWLFHRNYKCIDEVRTVVDALSLYYVYYGASATGNDSYAITPTPAISAYSAGQIFDFKVDVGNTGVASLNVSGKGVKTLKIMTLAGKTDLVTGNVIAGGTYTAIYDGTDCILLNPTSALEGLVLGSALQLLRVNAGGTALEYSGGYAQIVNGSYTGNGATDRTISLGFTPKFIWVSSGNGYGGVGITGNPYNLNLSGYSASPPVAITDNNSYRPTIVTNGFTVSSATGLNYNTQTFYYIAMG